MNQSPKVMEIINNLKQDGFKLKDIQAAMRDGEFLCSKKISADMAQAVYDRVQILGMFYRVNGNGDATIHQLYDGEPVSRIPVAGVYPIGSELGVSFKHSHGIVLKVEDAERIGIQPE